MVSKTLKPEYRQICFRCEERDLPPGFFVVTGHNPDGEKVEEEANLAADKRLRAELAGLGMANFPVTGGNADFSHAEAGYGIACTREEALRLARQFGQDTIFEVRNGEVFLLSALVSAEPDHRVGQWKALLRP